MHFLVSRAPQQRKVREFTEKFRLDPTSAGINYEKIHVAKDDKVRTVRIGRDYRAIVLHPGEGDVYVLAWVDQHDEAMDWTRNRTFEINPRTGSLQIIDVHAVETAVEDKPRGTKKRKGVLASFDDDLLLEFGVPTVLLPAVRAVQSADELQSLTKHLPAEAAEALLWLVEGIPPDEVRAAIAASAKTKVDTKDFEKALDHPDSRRRFVTIKSSDDLSAMLNAPLAKWRVFLHPSQEQLVSRKFNGPARVLGGAGTGKTVVAMHRARHLVEKVFTDPTDRILFTTFTANLAEDIEENLQTLCGDKPERIDVVHLHAWAVRFMRTQDVEYNIAADDDIRECWDEALSTSGIADWEPGFLRQEWDTVVQANGIDKKQDYLRVSRVGRGSVLSRSDRVKVWKLFDEFREALKTRGLLEWVDVIRETRKFL